MPTWYYYLFYNLHIFRFFLAYAVSRSRVGRGNLVLRHSVPHFLPNSGEWKSNPHLVVYILQSHFVPLRHDPRLRSSLVYRIFHYMIKVPYYRSSYKKKIFKLKYFVLQTSKLVIIVCVLHVHSTSIKLLVFV